MGPGGRGDAVRLRQEGGAEEGGEEGRAEEGGGEEGGAEEGGAEEGGAEEDGGGRAGLGWPLCPLGHPGLLRGAGIQDHGPGHAQASPGRLGLPRPGPRDQLDAGREVHAHAQRSTWGSSATPPSFREVVRLWLLLILRKQPTSPPGIFYMIFLPCFFSKSPLDNFAMGYDYVFVLGDD